MAVTKGRRQIIAALFLCAPRRGSTHLLPDAPTTVIDEAVDTVRPACDDPVERLWLAAMAQGLGLSHWRIETGGPAQTALAAHSLISPGTGFRLLPNRKAVSPATFRVPRPAG